MQLKFVELGHLGQVRTGSLGSWEQVNDRTIMHVTVGYWMHGVTILHEEAPEKEARLEHPAPRRTRDLDSPHAQQNGDPAVVRSMQPFTWAFGYLRSRLPGQSSAMCGPSLPYHVRAFPTFFVSLHLEHASSILCLTSSPYGAIDASADAAR